MNATWGLVTVLSLLCRTESRCSPTTYYKNCWIRRFPGIFINMEESQRRGAQLLRFYQEESALKCSRSCCLTRNCRFLSPSPVLLWVWFTFWLFVFSASVSCNLAVFHYDTSQENCFHLHCPTLESCVLTHRGNVVLYNITNGESPQGSSFLLSPLLPQHTWEQISISAQVRILLCL